MEGLGYNEMGYHAPTFPKTTFVPAFIKTKSLVVTESTKIRYPRIEVIYTI